MEETKKETKKETKFRSRKFQILGYPESAPKLVETLKELQWDFVGILHDKDKKQRWFYKKGSLALLY